MQLLTDILEVKMLAKMRENDGVKLASSLFRSAKMLGVHCLQRVHCRRAAKMLGVHCLQLVHCRSAAKMKCWSAARESYAMTFSSMDLG